MKEAFMEMELEIVYFAETDVIVTSPTPCSAVCYELPPIFCPPVTG